MPTSEALLKPQGIEPQNVTQKLHEYRERQKFYYDRGTRPQKPIGQNDAVRVFTKRGWEPAEYVREAELPRSHIIKAGEHAREYRRNRSHLMRTGETPHEIKPIRNPYVPMNLETRKPIAKQTQIGNPDRGPMSPPMSPNSNPLSPPHSPSSNVMSPPTSRVTRSGRESRLEHHSICVTMCIGCMHC